MPHLVQTIGKDARALTQLNLKRTYQREALAGKLAAFHADEIETGENSILPARKAIRDHVAAHAGESADHHLRTHPAELMHCRQAAHENKIADLAVPAERRRGRKNHVVADAAVVSAMAAIHEITAIASP